jgi:hypothetical protein
MAHGLHGFYGFTQIRKKIRENLFYPRYPCSINFVNKPGYNPLFNIEKYWAGNFGLINKKFN